MYLFWVRFVLFCFPGSFVHLLIPRRYFNISFMTIYISIYLFPKCVWRFFCSALFIMLQWITNVLFTTLVVC